MLNSLSELKPLRKKKKKKKESGDKEIGRNSNDVEQLGRNEWGKEKECKMLFRTSLESDSQYSTFAARDLEISPALCCPLNTNSKGCLQAHCWWKQQLCIAACDPPLKEDHTTDGRAQSYNQCAYTWEEQSRSGTGTGEGGNIIL